MALGKMLLLAIPVAVIAAVVSSDDDEEQPEGPRPPAGGAGPPPPPATPSGAEPSKPAGQPPGGAGSFIDRLPEPYSQERENMILAGVESLFYDTPQWKMVSSIGAEGSPAAGYKISIPVMADALKFDSVRVETDYRTAQLIADRMGVQMLTPFVDALSYEQADAKLSPTTFPWNAQMAATKTWMIKASKAIDDKIAAAGYSSADVPLVGNAGKVWVLTIKFSWPGEHPVSHVPHSQAAANHGLYTSAWQPIQNVGVAHNLAHTEYSQMLRYMGRELFLTMPDGSTTTVSTAAILEDPTLAQLLTGQKGVLRGKQVGEGPLPYSRHPAIPILVA